MTPERAAYHRLMLLLGFREEYERELDRILETEDPITQPALDLALCMSDLDRTVTVLGEYTLDYPLDEQEVYTMTVAELRRWYTDQQLNANQVCEIMEQILRICDFSDSWLGLYKYLYEYELLNEGLIFQEVFETGFDSAFLHDERIDVWKVQGQYMHRNDLSLLYR